MTKQKDLGPGYHVSKIDRGEYGEASKVLEEAQEFVDAVQQGVSIMALVELSDLLGAIDGYLLRHHPHLSRKDLEAMTRATARAFRNGHRSPTVSRVKHNTVTVPDIPSPGEISKIANKEYIAQKKQSALADNNQKAFRKFMRSWGIPVRKRK